jgi:hypothetical protein
MKLTCDHCRQPARPFPPEEIDGREVILTAEVQFVERLAYRCEGRGGCGGIFCARCCHPAPLVAAMIEPGRLAPPEPDSAGSGAKCPRCGAMPRRIRLGEAADEFSAPAKEEPVTWGQRLVLLGVGAFCLSIAVWCFGGGA